MATSNNFDATDMVVTTDDIERLAHAKMLPKVTTFYRDGADQQQTIAENLLAFKRLRLLPRVMRDVSTIDTECTLLGQRLSMPVGISPTALQKMAHPDGESATARAAANSGTVMVLSALSTTSMEGRGIPEHPGVSAGFQMEVVKDRSVTIDFLSRAERLGYGAIVLDGRHACIWASCGDCKKPHDLPRAPLDIKIVVTVFLHLIRTKNISFTPNRIFTFKKNLPVMAMCPPKVTYTFFFSLANFEGTNYSHIQGLKESCLEQLRESFDRSLTWDVLAWIKSITKLPVVVKGILTAEDACEAVNHGASAILVSNHGGRQLDGVPATSCWCNLANHPLKLRKSSWTRKEMLPFTFDADLFPRSKVLATVVRAVRGRCEVYMDGGVRRGTDVIKALALGARAVFVGRPVIWGLAYNGEEGVKKVLDIFKTELERALALMGKLFHGLLPVDVYDVPLSDIKAGMVIHHDSLKNLLSSELGSLQECPST
ncbi:hypothetical protein MRX96_019706 [Rhipicephalus microplus]